MKNLTKVLSILVFTFFISTHAGAAVIWDENTDGDLVNLNDFGYLALGSNTLTGTRSYTWDGFNLNLDVDAFYFSLWGTQSLDTVEVVVSNPVNDVNGAQWMSVLSIVADGTPIALNTVWREYSLGSGGNATINSLPLFGGDYFFGQGGSTSGLLGTASYDWSVTLTTSGTIGGSVVPVPAAVWLFGTALIGLVGFGKRKSKIAALPVYPHTM